MKAQKTLVQDPAQSAKAAQLRYVHSDEEGVHRRRRGKGWSYLQGEKSVRDKESLARFNALAIPPAWKDVWICADANGHLQATGIDAKGRKQYRYHAQWRKVRGEVKYVSQWKLRHQHFAEAPCTKHSEGNNAEIPREVRRVP